MTIASTMTFHRRPEPGEATPWAFPAPVRSTLPNGLTVLRCDRPGQKLVAVELLLDAPLAAEPAGQDGVATILARAFSEGTQELSAEEFAAELERAGANLDAHADHTSLRLSLEVPASRLERGLTLLADAVRAPALPEAEIERVVANRLDEIVHELANPGRRAAFALYGDLFDAADRISRPRAGTADTVKGIDREAVAEFYAAYVRPSTATAVIVGDFSAVDFDAVLASTLGDWTGTPAAASVPAPVTADDTGRVIIVDRPGSVQTRPGPRRSSAPTASVAPSPHASTRCCARRRATPTASAPSPSRCARRRTAAAGRCWRSPDRWTPSPPFRRSPTPGPSCATSPPGA